MGIRSKPLATVTEALSFCVLLITVISLPWMLGGVVPFARAVSLFGAVAAASAAGLSRIFRSREGGIPWVCLPVGVLAVIGLVQLLPIFSPPVLQMNHAVQPELLKLFADELPAKTVRTASTGDTRLFVALMLSLVLIAWTASDVIRTRRTLLITLWALSLNAVVMVLLGLLQYFQNDDFLMNSLWLLDGRNPFGAFVNPNNAAGWLCAGFAASAGLVSLLFGSGKSQDNSFQQPTVDRALSLFQRTVANLTMSKVAAVICLLFVATGTLATFSRGGSIALVSGFVALLVFRAKWWHLMTAVVTAVMVYGTVTFFGLTDSVKSELQTLNDPLTELSSRLTHWGDSLLAVRDFPILGTGLGAYQFATLPYQRHSFDAWMRNADNQYVEFLVEGGFAGLVAFLAIGVAGLLQCRTHYRSDLRWRGHSPGVCNAICVVVPCLVFSQAVAAIGDFGIALPATSALILLILGAASAAGGGNKHSDEQVKTTAVTWVGRRTGLVLRFSVIVAAASFLPDLLAATQISHTSVQAHHVLKDPASEQQLRSVGALHARLIHQLESRSDDSTGLRMALRLAEGQFRTALLTDVRNEDPDGYEFVKWWPVTSFEALIARQAELRRQGQIEALTEWRNRIRAALEGSGILRELAVLRRHIPLSPDTFDTLVAINAVTNGRSADVQQQINQAIAVEPHNPGTHFRLGLICSQLGKLSQTRELWRRCMDLSQKYHRVVLNASLEFWTPAEVCDQFAPADYSDCVLAAQTVQDGSLRELLWTRAEILWNQREFDEGDSPVVRSQHLESTGRRSDAIQWLTEHLKQSSKDVPSHICLAQLLEREGDFQQAEKQWHIIEFLDNETPGIRAALDRLRLKQRTSSPSRVREGRTR